MEQKKYLKEQNELILNELSNELVPRFGESYRSSELFMMQKLYLLYPRKVPKKLLELSWEHIKVLLNLFSDEERKFYIECCLIEKWSVEKLKEAILKDVYEKYYYVKKVYGKHGFDFHNFKEVLDFVWQES